MYSKAARPSDSSLSALGQLDLEIRIDTDCVCAAYLSDEENELYNEILPVILTYYRDGQTLDDHQTKQRGRHLCDLAIMTPGVAGRGTEDGVVADAIMKTLLYIVSKDIGVKKNKTATFVSNAVELIHTLSTEIFIFPDGTKKNSHIKTPLLDPVALNDTVVEVCLHGTFDPLRIPPGETAAPKANIKAYRSFHEVLFGLHDHGWLTSHSKATAGYLAVTLYFGDLERASELNDMVWIAASWLIKAAEDIFKWKHDEVGKKWVEWREHLIARKNKMKDARAGEGEAGELEKGVGEAAENMLKSLKQMRRMKDRRAEIRAKGNAALEKAATKKD